MNSGLEVNTKFFPLQWMLFLVKPTVEINGQPYSVPWGKQFAPLAPGNYHVKIFFPWMGQGGVAETQIQVLQSRGHGLEYNAPLHDLHGGERPPARHQALRHLSH